MAIVTLLGLYVWSHGGQTTKAVLKVRGDHVAVYVDGRLSVKGDLAMPVAGGVFLTLADRRLVPKSGPRRPTQVARMHVPVARPHLAAVDKRDP